MSINYPSAIDVFTNPSGTSTLDSPDHALQHSDANDAIEAIEAVIGTTAGTSVLKDFSAGEFPARVNSGGTLTQTLTGGTINATTLGTPTVTSPLYQGLIDGWVSANETWTYASATTFTVASDVTSKYQKGDKIKFTQATDGVKYMYIVGVSESGGTTTIKVTGGSDYDLDNEAITANYYSKVENPQGFPDWFNYSPSLANLTLGNGTVTALFKVSNLTCFVYCKIVLGSTSAVGTNPYISMPVARVLLGNNTGTAVYNNAGTGRSFGHSWIETANRINFMYDGSGYSTITATVPFTWAVNDSLEMNIFYGI